MSSPELSVSAPGRICLFGEHQDYLGLAVVAAAIDRRISISGSRRPDGKFIINLPDVGGREEFFLGPEIPYTKARDYLRSGVNIVRRCGTPLHSGWEVTVRGEIPINAGTSSSSALVIAWVMFLLEAASDPQSREPERLAELGYLAEVAEFREPGGMMDHYASACGGVVWIECGTPLALYRLPNPLEEFVLADSLEKKDTTGTLGSIKGRTLEASAELKTLLPAFSLKTSALEDIKGGLESLSPNSRKLLEGAFLMRDLTREGLGLIQAENFDHVRLGELLNREQAVLRNNLGVSTPKIDRMLEAALEAGALGGKINGSGGGGCVFAYCPGRAAGVAEAFRRQGGQAFIVRVDEGARVEP